MWCTWGLVLLFIRVDHFVLWKFETRWGRPVFSQPWKGGYSFHPGLSKHGLHTSAPQHCFFGGTGASGMVPQRLSGIWYHDEVCGTVKGGIDQQSHLYHGQGKWGPVACPPTVLQGLQPCFSSTAFRCTYHVHIVGDMSQCAEHFPHFSDFLGPGCHESLGWWHPWFRPPVVRYRMYYKSPEPFLSIL